MHDLVLGGRYNLVAREGRATMARRQSFAAGPQQELHCTLYKYSCTIAKAAWLSGALAIQKATLLVRHSTGPAAHGAVVHGAIAPAHSGNGHIDAEYAARAARTA